MTRLLWVTEEAPDRNLGGGNIRQAHLLDALGQAFDTTVLMAGPLGDSRTRAAVSRVIEVPRPDPSRPKRRSARRLVDLRLALFGRQPRDVWEMRRVRATLRRALRAADAAGSYDLVVVTHQGLMGMLPPRRTSRWVAHFHHVAADRARQTAATAAGGRQRWLYQRDAHHAARFERWAVAAYDAVVACSEYDALALTGPERASAAGPVFVAPNGVDSARFTPTPLPGEPRVVLTATLDYLPNVDGVQWFVSDVLPRVRQQVPGVVFDIVGRHPTPDVIALGSPGAIEVHADVADVAPFLARARVAVVPLRMGTGTRLKALEALAAGRPLVGTSIGLDGLGLVDGIHARIANRPDAMADAVIGLLHDDGPAEAMAAAGRSLVEQHHRWDVIGPRLAADLAAWIKG